MKVLVISHNCFSTYNNMGKTLMSLFPSFSKEELCQLYIYPSLPDVDICGAYYRITDKAILRSILSLREPGTEIDPDQLTVGNATPLENAQDAAIYGQKRNFTAMARLARDLMWSMSHWYSKSLRNWLDREAPQVIFLAPGYAKFIYDIALRIAKERNIPIITYICDDYYFLKRPDALIDRLQLSLLQKKTDQLMRKTSRLVVICEELREVYGDFFSVPADVIMTSCPAAPAEKEIVLTDRRTISYFGNLQRNRGVSLAEVGEALDRLNRSQSAQYVLNVYTSESNPEILESLKSKQSVCLKGFVSGKDFSDAVAATDFLLHAEAFDEEAIDLVKYSVSTKIAESLTGGIPLIAYGPASVSSMKHLIRNQCALVITDKADLEGALRGIDRNLCLEIVSRARHAAGQYHSSRANGDRMRKLVEREAQKGCTEDAPKMPAAKL